MKLTEVHYKKLVNGEGTMGIAIYLRKSKNINYFRDIILDSINSGEGDSAIICSGFFQENFKNNSYQVSLEGNFADSLKNNNIKLTTIGIHNSTWKNSYRNFVNNLRTKGVNITPLYKNRLRWHAKVYILKRENNPLLGIVGSSNFTRTAFSVNTTFNYEADVVLWTKKSKKN